MKNLTQQEIGEKYTGAAREYDVWMKFLELLFLRKLRRQLLQHARGKVLEVGVGTGLNFEHYPQKCKITGIDYTQAMLVRARKRAAELGRKIFLKQGDAQQLSFKRERFDTVVDTLCLCTYPNPVRALQEMMRVCKKGGQILLLEHGRSNRTFIQRLQRWQAEKQYQNIGCHLLRDPERLIRRAGLKIVESRRAYFGIFYLIRVKL